MPFISFSSTGRPKHNKGSAHNRRQLELEMGVFLIWNWLFVCKTCTYLKYASTQFDTPYKKLKPPCRGDVRKQLITDFYNICHFYEAIPQGILSAPSTHCFLAHVAPFRQKGQAGQVAVGRRTSPTLRDGSRGEIHGIEVRAWRGLHEFEPAVMKISFAPPLDKCLDRRWKMLLHTQPVSTAALGPPTSPSRPPRWF